MNFFVKHNTLFRVLLTVFVLLYALLQTGTAVAMENKKVINDALGVKDYEIVETGDGNADTDYYKSDYANLATLMSDTQDKAAEVMAEGAVLVKNDNDALPLTKGSYVGLFGYGSYSPAYGGSGSAASKNPKPEVTMLQGMTDAGLTVNETLWNFYKNNPRYAPAAYSTNDAPWSDLVANSAVASSLNTRHNAAIVVVSRSRGENYDPDLNYLQLSANEKSLLLGLKELKGKTVDKVIVLFNTPNQVETDFLDDPTYGVDAALWVGTVGQTGLTAVGKILVGDVNPSGRLSDTWWNKHTYNPAYTNFGATRYANADEFGNLPAEATDPDDSYTQLSCTRYVSYTEGIYVGYRYTETRYEDVVTTRANAGNFDYNKVVTRPFGYGLSYTSFDYTDMSVSYNRERDVYTVSVNVTNTGAKVGKEVVQLYLQKPYTDYDVTNGVEKAAVELVGYAKTGVLAAGASQTVTISVAERSFASYDANEAKTYVIGSTDSADNYYLTVAEDAHEAINNILAQKGVTRSTNPRMDKDGNAANVWDTHIEFDAEKYSTNETIKSANFNFTARYEGEQANYGVSKITNQFEDVDFQKYDGFDAEERSQTYTTRSNWTGTLNGSITLTATAKLAADMATPTPEQDPYDYPTNGADNATTLALLRADEDGNLLDYSNPLWDDLLDKISWKEMCEFLSNGLRLTEAIGSINAPQTLQFNGAVGPVPGDAENNSKYDFNATGAPWEGFAKELGSGTEEYPNFFVCNGIVAATYNTEVAEQLGKQIGEECLWAGMSGIYGYGINLHRGSYCGRNFEYYSEDGFLTGMACAYEVKGTQSKGVFVILKHALLNEQETNRHAMGVWANEQSIRELYLAPVELCIEYGDEMQMMGMMTGLNRMGAKWSSIQGFCNTVLRGEMGMNGFVISDFYPKNEKDAYMNPIAGVMYGNDLPDGTVVRSNSTFDGVTNDFDAYSVGYGKLAWQMRDATHRVLYVVARSAAMNKITNDTVVVKITPAWQVALKASTITAYVLFAASVGFVAFSYLYKRKTTKA